MEAAHELLGALRVPVAFVEPLKPLQGFNERAVVFGTGLLVATLLHHVLDHEQRLPHAKHVRIGRDVLRILLAGAAGVDANPCAVEGLIARGVAVGVAGERLPDVRPFQEVQARAGHIDALE